MPTSTRFAVAGRGGRPLLSANLRSPAAPCLVTPFRPQAHQRIARNDPKESRKVALRLISRGRLTVRRWESSSRSKEGTSPARRIARERSGGARDGETECRARSVVGHRPQLSVMILDDRTADRQTDAQAMRFCRVERFEELVDAARIQADAGVLNEQFDAVAAMDLRLNSERSRPV